MRETLEPGTGSSRHTRPSLSEKRRHGEGLIQPAKGR